MLELIGRAKTGWAAVDITPANSLVVNDNYANNVMNAISMSSDGTRVAVGISTLYENGVVKIFFFNGTAWVLEKTFNNPFPTYSNLFGLSVTMSGDGLYLLVGYPGYTTNSQGCYILYTRSVTAWTYRGINTEAAGAAANNKFANSICFSRDSNYVIVGSPGKTGNKGAAYIYQRVSATALTYKATLPQTAKIVIGSYFGNRVLIDNTGTRCVVLCPGITSMLVYTGGGTTWSLEGTISSVPATQDDNISMDLNGSVIAVSNTSYNSNSGMVTLYKRTGTTWAYLCQIVEPTPASNRLFGKSITVSADGTKILITSVSNPLTNNNPKAYVYNIPSFGEATLFKTLGSNDVTGDNWTISKYSHGCANDSFTKLALMTRRAGIGDADIIESFNL